MFASLKSNQGRTFEEIEYAYDVYTKKANLFYRKPGHNATATYTVISGKGITTTGILLRSGQRTA